MYYRRFSGRATTLLMIANIAVFVFCCMNQRGFGYWIDAGGLSYVSAVDGQELFRVVTSMFLHGSVAHILCNMYSLGSIGSLVESAVGWFEYLVIYFVSGICGSLVVLFADHRSGNVFQITVGASGAIFGLFGAYLALLLTRCVTGGSAARMISCIAVMLLSGLFQANISVSAHLGGCAGGFLFCFLVSLFKRPKARVRSNEKRMMDPVDRDGFV